MGRFEFGTKKLQMQFGQRRPFVAVFSGDSTILSPFSHRADLAASDQRVDPALPQDFSADHVQIKRDVMAHHVGGFFDGRPKLFECLAKGFAMSECVFGRDAVLSSCAGADGESFRRDDSTTSFLLGSILVRQNPAQLNESWPIRHIRRGSVPPLG